MRKSLLLWISLASLPSFAQANPAAPVALPPDSSKLHLLSETPPVYPPIARAAHIEGTVSLEIEIGPDGHIRSAKTLSGPEMLQASARDTLRHRLYAPVLDGGKPVTATTTITVPFDLKAPPSQYAQPSAADMRDRKLDWRMHTLLDDCTSSLESNSPPAKEIERCRKAADLADQYSENGLFLRREVYTVLSTALRRNHQLPDALDAANKAVAAVQEGFLEGPAACAAYSVRAQAEAQMGHLAQASHDLTLAEDAERTIIARVFAPASGKDVDKRSQAFVRTNYIPVLKGLLLLHSRILNSLGESTEAAARLAEANTL